MTTTLRAHGRHISAEGFGCEYPIAAVSEVLPEEEAYVFARLIASAPDLLEALKGMMSLSNHKHRYHGPMVCDACVAVKNAHAAIAKAQERKE